MPKAAPDAGLIRLPPAPLALFHEQSRIVWRSRSLRSTRQRTFQPAHDASKPVHIVFAMADRSRSRSALVQSADHTTAPRSAVVQIVDAAPLHSKWKPVADHASR